RGDWTKVRREAPSRYPQAGGRRVAPAVRTDMQAHECALPSDEDDAVFEILDGLGDLEMLEGEIGWRRRRHVRFHGTHGIGDLADNRVVVAATVIERKTGGRRCGIDQWETFGRASREVEIFMFVNGQRAPLVVSAGAEVGGKSHGIARGAKAR